MPADTAYPKLVEHAAAHRALLNEPAAIRSRLGGDGKAPPESGRALLDVLKVVTIRHIVSSSAMITGRTPFCSGRRA
jgi:hypothetical protein